MKPSILFELLRIERLTEVVDIGANPIDGDPPYKAMLGDGLCKVTGFEPQDDAFAELIKKKSPNERYFPWAVGDGQTHKLNICAASGMTGIFTPDPKVLAVFEAFKSLGKVLRQVDVATRRLDDMPEIEHMDFLKIDIQGAEHSVFQNGMSKLTNAVAIQTEVSFVCLYEQQPALGEIDSELRRQGFIPHCLVAVKTWPIAPCVINNNPRQALNQLLEADIVYVRDFTRPELMSTGQLKHLAMIAHHCYGSIDLALRCILMLEERGELPAGTQQKYVSSLPPLKNQT
jgi:FkbM family methyltransferase